MAWKQVIDSFLGVWTHHLMIDKCLDMLYHFAHTSLTERWWHIHSFRGHSYKRSLLSFHVYKEGIRNSLGAFSRFHHATTYPSTVGSRSPLVRIAWDPHLKGSSVTGWGGMSASVPPAGPAWTAAVCMTSPSGGGPPLSRSQLNQPIRQLWPSTTAMAHGSCILSLCSSSLCCYRLRFVPTHHLNE